MGRWARASLWLGGVALVLVAILWLTPWGGFAMNALPVGSGVSAQLACGGVFVSGRKLDDVVRHDIWRLSPLTQKDSFKLDPKVDGVTVATYGLAARTSIYRPGIGCTLLVDSDATSLRRQAQDIRVPAPTRRPGLWPEGDEVALSTTPALALAVKDSFTDDTRAHDIDTRAIVVVHKGRIVAERYADGFAPDTPQLGWSMSKSVTAALVGTLIADGDLALDAPAPVPEWTVAGDARRKITLRNLLNMSSGLAFNEPYDPGSDSTAMLFQSHDMGGYAATRPLTHPPGTYWSYSSGTANIASRIVKMKSGGTLASLENYAQSHLFAPLRMTSAVFEPDESGNFVGSSYLYASARDWARFGLFILNDGVAGSRRLLPEGYVHFLCTPAPAAPDKGYGGMFWLNGLDAKGVREFLHLPADYCAAEGHNDEFVAIFPSRQTVIVRLGWTGDGFRFDRDRHFGAILAALPK